MDSERPPNLRTVGSPGEQAAGTGAQPLGSGMAINATAELVLDFMISFSPDRRPAAYARGVPLRSACFSAVSNASS